jgi:suppressor of ftsI/bilirubin oxidase
MQTRRRDFLKGLGALTLAGLPRAALSDGTASVADSPLRDFCGASDRGKPLFVPGDRGFLGRLAPGDDILTLRAASVAANAGVNDPAFSLGYVASHRGRDYVNPALQLRSGQRVRIAFVNEVEQPTIVHWHGLAVDTANDGGGMSLAAPGERYSYDFTVRDRAALYWYHPHPHGLTAGQAYRGLFGMMDVEDADNERLRAALDLVPGRTEIPLVLQDRRGGDYAASDADRMHGYLGDDVMVNGTSCPYLDVGTRIYRFRVLNASNARTYRLGLRTAAGKPVPFTLIGTDAGLLPSPVRCQETFLASAERIDILIDLSDASVGDTLVLETGAFDPMHMEMPASAGAAPDAGDHAAMGHAMPPNPASAAGTSVDHAMAHGGSFPEGARRGLLQFRVRERIAYSARVPTRLSEVSPIAAGNASERPLRLGFAKGRWRINDRVFAMGETPIEVKRDTVETWLIRNYFNSMPHAMHLHGFHFQVLERQTSPDQVAALKVDGSGRLASDLGWKDTVLVWPGESVRIAIDFAMPFQGAQTYMVHCHNLEHEDGGMMLGMKIA